MTKTATPDLALKLRWYGDKKKWPKGLEDLPALLLEASAALASPPPAVEPVAVKPLEWRHDGHGSYCYCPVTDTRWTARNQHERDRSDERRAARIRSALDTPSTDLREDK